MDKILNTKIPVNQSKKEINTGRRIIKFSQSAAWLVDDVELDARLLAAEVVVRGASVGAGLKQKKIIQNIFEQIFFSH